VVVPHLGKWLRCLSHRIPHRRSSEFVNSNVIVLMLRDDWSVQEWHRILRRIARREWYVRRHLNHSEGLLIPDFGDRRHKRGKAKMNNRNNVKKYEGEKERNSLSRAEQNIV
jgi:hypothetical protein